MKALLISIIIFMFFLTGCIPPTMSKEKFSPKMYSEHPISILVLPPANKSTAADAKDYYLTTVAEPLTNTGYYVFPIEIVSEVLKQEGLSDVESMANVPPQKFAEFFGADAVLYVSILKWNTSYLILSGDVTVQIECELKSTKSGESLWYYNEEIKVNTTDNTNYGGGLAGLLVQAVGTALKTAMTDYVPVALNVNKKIMLALPFGQHHGSFNLDRAEQVLVKAKIK